ncbi:MAG: DUF1501 domain-containing protein [Verrucomicrobiales bacterium]
MNGLSTNSRRDFIKGGLGMVGAGAALPHFLPNNVIAGPVAQKDGPILVVIQLAGGHDGLSAVVPYTNDDYYKARPKCAYAKNEVLRINDELGFSPAMTGFKELMDEGQLAVIQGIGYPNHNRSHFTSMEIWKLADRERKETEGWLGRYIDAAFEGDPNQKLAIAVRMAKTPLAIKGREHPGVSFSDANSFRYRLADKDEGKEMAYRDFNKVAMKKGEVDSLDHVTRTATNANVASDEVRAIVAQYKGSVKYPKTKLGSALKMVGALIAGGLGSRVYYVQQGGFDTHTQVKTRHPKLMKELCDASLAFQKDLEDQGNAEQVASMVWSEFGRRVKENYSLGLDHGQAGPMFVFGSGIAGGVYGDLPSLAESDLDKGDLKYHTDFRSVYATLLEDWMGSPSEKILGDAYPRIGFVG